MTPIQRFLLFFIALHNYQLWLFLIIKWFRLQVNLACFWLALNESSHNVPTKKSFTHLKVFYVFVHFSVPKSPAKTPQDSSARNDTLWFIEWWFNVFLFYSGGGSRPKKKIMETWNNKAHWKGAATKYGNTWRNLQRTWNEAPIAKNGKNGTTKQRGNHNSHRLGHDI